MRFFSVDNPVWRFIRKIGYLWLLNILWVLTSLPVITIGASTTALFYACMKLQGDEGYPTANYFRSFRENFRQATIIWLIYAAVGALLVYGLIFWNLMDGTTLRVGHAFAIAILIPYGLSLLYVFAIQAKFVNSVRDTIHYGWIAYLLSIYFMRVFERYIPKTVETEEAEEPKEFNWEGQAQEPAEAGPDTPQA